MMDVEGVNVCLHELQGMVCETDRLCDMETGIVGIQGLVAGGPEIGIVEVN